jgi:quercetin dioxygenase-like cupin family protein
MMDRMNALPSFAEFEAAERARGCTEVIVRAWDPGQIVNEHSHPFEARALVVAGEMWLTVGSETRHLRPGERFELTPHQLHAERYGPEGATYWVARTA